jgi:hypothetical protein
MVDKCLGHQTLSAVQLGAAIAPTVPSGTREMWVQADTANVRYTLDGTTVPTAAVGMIVVAGAHQALVIRGSMSMKNASFIAESGSPKLNIMYIGQSDT